MMISNKVETYEDPDNSELIKGEEDKGERERLQEKLNKLSHELAKAHEEYKFKQLLKIKNYELTKGE